MPITGGTGLDLSLIKVVLGSTQLCAASFSQPVFSFPPIGIYVHILQ